jgi:hypothetical protein
MRTIKGPGVFLAQFAADDAPYNSLPTLAKWAADKGFKGVQIPTWDTRLIDMKQAAESNANCDELKCISPMWACAYGVRLISLASSWPCILHDKIMDSFAPQHVRRHPPFDMGGERCPPSCLGWASIGMSPSLAPFCGLISIPIRNGQKDWLKKVSTS